MNNPQAPSEAGKLWFLRKNWSFHMRGRRFRRSYTPSHYSCFLWLGEVGGGGLSLGTYELPAPTH